MKYVQGGSFVDKQFSIDETITEISDVVAIAKNISKNLSDNVSDDVKKELNLRNYFLKSIKANRFPSF